MQKELNECDIQPVFTIINSQSVLCSCWTCSLLQTLAFRNTVHLLTVCLLLYSKQFLLINTLFLIVTVNKIQFKLDRTDKETQNNNSSCRVRQAWRIKKKKRYNDEERMKNIVTSASVSSLQQGGPISGMGTENFHLPVRYYLDYRRGS